MFPSTSSRETSGLSEKQNCFPWDDTLSVYCSSYETYDRETTTTRDCHLGYTDTLKNRFISNYFMLVAFCSPKLLTWCEIWRKV